MTTKADSPKMDRKSSSIGFKTKHVSDDVDTILNTMEEGERPQLGAWFFTCLTEAEERLNDYQIPEEYRPGIRVKAYEVFGARTVGITIERQADDAGWLLTFIESFSAPLSSISFDFCGHPYEGGIVAHVLDTFMSLGAASADPQ